MLAFHHNSFTSVIQLISLSGYSLLSEGLFEIFASIMNTSHASRHLFAPSPLFNISYKLPTGDTKNLDNATLRGREGCLSSQGRWQKCGCEVCRNLQCSGLHNEAFCSIIDKLGGARPSSARRHDRHGLCKRRNIRQIPASITTQGTSGCHYHVAIVYGVFEIF